MIFKIIKLILFILIIWYLSEFFANSEGETSINWMGWGIQIPTDRFVLILILFSVVIIFIDRIWLAFLNFPKAAFRRFEVNNNYVEQLVACGLVVGGRSEDGELVEMIELKDHPWFLACQFHPEFTSSPRRGHPLFTGFIHAGLEYAKQAAS